MEDQVAPTPEYDLVYRCRSEWNDCSWFTRSYDEIDAHEALFGHYVTGQMERINPPEQRTDG